MGLAWYDNTDTAIAGRPQFLGVNGGVPTAAQIFHIWNDLGGGASPIATNLSLHALSKDFGDTTFLECGHEFVDRKYFEARIVSGLGALVVSTGPWVDLGCAGASLALPNIASGSGVVIEVRVSAPAGAANGHYCPSLQIRNSASESIGTAGEAIADGVLFTADQALRSAGDAVENPGGVDDQVQVQQFFWSSGGETYASVQQLVQVDGNDGVAAALAAGEAYYAIVYGASDGSIAVAKGSKAVSPLSPADEPAVPTGGTPICRVLREFDGLVNDTDIDQLVTVGAFDLVGSTLTVTVGSGEAIVGSSKIRLTSTSAVTLTANATNTIYLASDGSFGVTTTGSPTEPGSLPLWRVVTDGVGVVSTVDLRSYGGTRRLAFVRFEFPAGFAVSSTAYAFWPEQAAGNLRPFGVVAALHEPWAGATGGAVTFDVEVAEPGAAFSSLFPAGSSPPSIDPASPDLSDKSAFPSATQVPGCSRLRATVSGLPTGGATTEGAELLLLLEV